MPPLIMGVVNVTPDSFSDGGRYHAAEAAIAHGRQLLADGADILDVGGEATNPRATPVDARTELARVLPVVEALAAAGATVSIDTTKAEVAARAVAAGARIVNDVSAGRFDPDMLATVAGLDVTYVAGHLRGSSIAEVFAREGAVTWREVADELAAQLAQLPEAARRRVWVDACLGFGKGGDPETNLELVRHTRALGQALGAPVLVGPSRKRFLAKLVGRSDELALDGATVALCLAAADAGASVLRVHNVSLLRAALAVYTRM